MDAIPVAHRAVEAHVVHSGVSQLLANEVEFSENVLARSFHSLGCMAYASCPVRSLTPRASGVPGESLHVGQ